MNGIIHPCTHPEGRPPPKNEEEMMLEIFHYVDRHDLLFHNVRNPKLVISFFLLFNLLFKII
jgi:5'-3' exonuclease